MSVSERLSLIGRLCKYLTVISEQHDDKLVTLEAVIGKASRHTLYRPASSHYNARIWVESQTS